MTELDHFHAHTLECLGRSLTCTCKDSAASGEAGLFPGGPPPQPGDDSGSDSSEARRLIDKQFEWVVLDTESTIVTLGRLGAGGARQRAVRMRALLLDIRARVKELP